MRALIIISIACLAIGVGLIFYYCQGSTNFSFAYPLDATSLRIDITTTGPPALIGIFLTIFGAILVIITWFIALVRPLSRPRTLPRTDEEPHRREEPFVE
jgi:hypothetical protein